ncbi:hypothetical protein, partial [Streptococcus pneumoniae]|uniref:hypothetical protein n=1 Tax=Streptococcus pneumoniae TaxID=1313 RepID=UPI0016624B23
GSLLYRDDQVLAFTFPGQRSDDEGNQKRSLDDDAAKELRDWISKEVDELAEKWKFETPPICTLSSSTRSFIPMAREGSLLYRDDQVLAFTFPGQRSDDEGNQKRSLDD